jgi:hypothetical protein
MFLHFKKYNILIALKMLINHLDKINAVKFKKDLSGKESHEAAEEKICFPKTGYRYKKWFLLSRCN